MIYPPQTSLIPTTVSLLRFINERGMAVFSLNYPYWYLGSTPYKYLIGPVVPILEYLIHQILPQVPTFSLIIYIVLVSTLLGGVGWAVLIKKILGKRFSFSTAYYILFTTIYFLFPWKYLSSLALAEATVTIAKNMIPFVIVTVWMYLIRRNKLWFAISSLSIALILLINTSVSVTLIIGIIGLCLTVSFKNGKFRHIDKKLKRVLLPFLVGLALATLWYSPGFWWVQLINPGIGGAIGLSAIFKAFDFLKNFIPLVLVVTVLKFNHKIKERIMVFALTWVLTFFALSIFRFLANPEFWMDWASWFTEIEVGVALFIAALYAQNGKKWDIKIFLVGLLPLSVTLLAYFGLGQPRFVSSALPIATQSLDLTKDMPLNSRIFVTGANTFWLNAFYDRIQVRGGRDEVAVNSLAIPAAYILRENQKKDMVVKQLNDLKIDYVLVNTEDSKDFYKDYKNLSVWGHMGKVVGSTNGDYLVLVKSD